MNSFTNMKGFSLNIINRNLIQWVIPEKIHTPMTEGMVENLTGGGLTALEIQT